MSLKADKTLINLIESKISIGKYSEVREILKSGKDSIMLKYYLAILECIENNFEQSKKYYDECLLEPILQHKSFLALANLQIQFGNYDVAQKMFETLRFVPRYYNIATFDLIYLFILKGDYLEAQKLIKEIDVTKLSIETAKYYNILNICIGYYLNDIKLDYGKLCQDRNYTIHRLFDNDDSRLIKHVEKHYHPTEGKNDGYFFKNINIEKLINESKDIIGHLNANHFQNSDIYKFKLDRSIGYVDGIETSDLCVITMLGTQKILTMYPIILSDEFDKEGMSTSEKLKLRRMQGKCK